MSIQIQTTPAVIGIQTNPGKVNIESGQADLEMKTTLPKVEIHNTFTQVQIDQTVPFSESGLKPVLDWAFDAAQLGRAAVENFTGNIAEQGDAMANIQNKTDVIAEQADSNAFGQFEHEFNIDSMPKTAPDIRFIDGKADVQVVEGETSVHITPTPVKINVEKASAEIYLQQKNSINISYSFDKQI